MDETGNQIGIIPTQRAQNIARERGYDLVEINPNSNPPVCKLLDFGQYKYKIEKQQRKQKSKQKKIEIKGIRFTMRTDEHDLEFKRRQADKFLEKGHKVKLELALKGREYAHRNIAEKMLKDFANSLEHPVKIDQEPKKQGLGIVMVIRAE
ncbi:MAG: translation initiation factor IF-3 [Candidatus Omnitrophica bacterium]|nr:translation initiation factor IF-3 [Candidatus Omnitrophota bacterium]